jgi:hypothetical protein
MRTVVFRAPSGCANKIAPQFQPHRPLTSYLLNLRPMNAPPRGIFSIAPPIGAPFFLFGGIGLPPLRGPITGDAIGPRGPLPTGGAIGPRGPLLTGGAIGPIAGGAIGLRPAIRSGIGLFGILSCGIGCHCRPCGAQLQEMLLAHEGPYPQEALLAHEGPYSQEVLLVHEGPYLQEALLAHEVL